MGYLARCVQAWFLANIGLEGQCVVAGEGRVSAEIVVSLACISACFAVVFLRRFGGGGFGWGLVGVS